MPVKGNLVSINIRDEVTMNRKRFATILLGGASLCAVAIAGICCLFADEYRFWKTAEGRKSSVKLKIVEQVGDSVKLKREDNGRTVDISLDKLSEEDREYLRKLAGNGSGKSNQASSENWPNFRGPNRTGSLSDQGVPLEWSATENLVWKTELPGPGTSSPITFGNHVYVTCYSGYGLNKESPGDIANLVRHLICIDRDSGKILWNKEMPLKARDSGYGGFMALHGYATHTPAADEEGVYVFYGASGAAAYSHEGELRWHKSCGTGVHNWGSGSSPVLYKNLLIVHADVESNTIFAFDKKTGEEKWSQTYQPGNHHTRATPLIVNQGQGDEVVFHSRQGWLSALDPASGKKIWEIQGTSNYQNPSPVIGDNTIFALTYGKTVAAGPGGELIWSANKGSEMVTPVFHDGHLYWADEQGIARCLDTKTGKLIYEERLRPLAGKIYSSGVLAGGRIYYVSRENGTYVVEASPQFKLLAHNQIESDKSIFNATPAISRGQLLLRSDKYLYCIGKKVSR